MSATGGETGLTVLAAPNDFLTSVMWRSEVTVGKCVGRQDLDRKRRTSGFSAMEFYRAEILFEFNLHDLALQLYGNVKYYATDTIYLPPLGLGKLRNMLTVACKLHF